MKFNKSMLEYVEIIRDKMNEKAPLKNELALKYFDKVFNYSDFLSQKLEIWMFVPAVFKDGKWVVLSKPMHPISDNITEEGLHGRYRAELKEYQTALSKVIFEGFEYNEALHQLKCYTDYCRLDTIGLEKYTIESLIKYNLDIKDTIAKELGLI